jgi:hypothetical protein
MSRLIHLPVVRAQRSPRLPKPAKEESGAGKPREQAEQGTNQTDPKGSRLRRNLTADGYYQWVYDKSKTGEAIREFCREANTTLDTYTRLVGASRRAVASWLAGDVPSRANQRTLSEMSRLFVALAEVVPASQIGQWLGTPSPSFEGSTPLQVIERGESDRVWRMIWEIQTGRSGE